MAVFLWWTQFFQLWLVVLNLYFLFLSLPLESFYPVITPFWRIDCEAVVIWWSIKPLHIFFSEIFNFSKYKLFNLYKNMIRKYIYDHSLILHVPVLHIPYCNELCILFFVFFFLLSYVYIYLALALEIKWGTSASRGSSEWSCCSFMLKGSGSGIWRMRSSRHVQLGHDHRADPELTGELTVDPIWPGNTLGFCRRS